MNIPRSVVGFLTSRGLVIATAESCTAGLIASLLADVPGSGACLDVGLVVYSPSGKCGFLNVEARTIERFGLTSEEVAREMAAGLLAQEACHAHIVVANTGLAGPPPDGSDLAPGTQCFAWRYKQRERQYAFSETRVFDGDRVTIRQCAALYALSRVEHYFNELPNVRHGRSLAAL
ncbi:CinA family protein [Paraburkholderia sp. 22099]|jgi:PncC family amidohydrolase|uniref:CinA family protein n=1 Tax=Paraburkholderia sp. 22099 TaxID=3453875 RepID=UPI003F84C16E